MVEMDRVEMSLQMGRDCPTQDILAGPMSGAEVLEGTI
jgi:hypothetical protein